MENQELRKKKILYRSWYRGNKEADKILGFYVRSYINELSESEISELETLLEEQDNDLYNWISGAKPIPEDLKNNSMMKKIIEYSISDEFTKMNKF